MVAKMAKVTLKAMVACQHKITSVTANKADSIGKRLAALEEKLANGKPADTTLES